MKVIFLDIDGVLNASAYEASLPKKKEKYLDEVGPDFYSPAVSNLQEIIRQTGGKIVIISRWRLRGLEEMQTMWASLHLPGEIIGVTPNLLHEAKNLSNQRGEELRQWVIQYGRDISSFVILDDQNDYYPRQLRHLVRPCHEWGLTESDVQQALEITREPTDFCERHDVWADALSLTPYGGLFEQESYVLITQDNFEDYKDIDIVAVSTGGILPALIVDAQGNVYLRQPYCSLPFSNLPNGECRERKKIGRHHWTICPGWVELSTGLGTGVILREDFIERFDAADRSTIPPELGYSWLDILLSIIDSNI